MERDNAPGGVTDDNPYRGWTAGITGGDGLFAVVMLALALSMMAPVAPVAANDGMSQVMVAKASNAARLEDGIAAWDAGDYDTAATILKPLADAGDPRFQEWFGQIHTESQDDAPSGSKTVQYLKFAAAIGDPDAQASLGVRYLNGVGGVDKNENQGVFLLQQAANQDITLAILALGSYYFPFRPEGQSSDHSDFDKSAYYLKKTAHIGESQAQTLLGILFTIEALKMSPDTSHRGEFLAYGLMWVRVADLGGDVDKAGAFFRDKIDFLKSKMNLVLFTAFRAGIEIRAQKCLKSKFENCGTEPKPAL